MGLVEAGLDSGVPAVLECACCTGLVWSGEDKGQRGPGGPSRGYTRYTLSPSLWVPDTLSLPLSVCLVGVVEAPVEGADAVDEVQLPRYLWWWRRRYL